MKMKYTQSLMVIVVSVIFLISNNAFAVPYHAIKRHAQYEKDLNEIYNKILKEYSHDAEFIKKLEISQNIWIKFRDAEVEMSFPHSSNGSYHYGRVYPMCVNFILEKITRDRIKTLQLWLDGTREGNVCGGSVKMNKSDR